MAPLRRGARMTDIEGPPGAADDMPDFSSVGVILAPPEEGDYYCTFCDMFLPPTHVEDHLIGKMHRRNSIGDQRHIEIPVKGSELSLCIY